mmetsp:Transcript_96908/g.260603  ORF Transcript_96908/g.260603 Transcript_96908/m.260603 type:complete len:237 (+) Transcript_96908:63-773(+)
MGVAASRQLAAQLAAPIGQLGPSSARVVEVVGQLLAVPTKGLRKRLELGQGVVVGDGARGVEDVARRLEVVVELAVGPVVRRGEVLEVHRLAAQVVQHRVHLAAADLAKVAVFLALAVDVVHAERFDALRDLHVVGLVAAELGVGRGVGAAADGAVADRRPVGLALDLKVHLAAVALALVRREAPAEKRGRRRAADRRALHGDALGDGAGDGEHRWKDRPGTRRRSTSTSALQTSA